MSEGILKLFVKDYKQTDNPAVRSKCAVAAGWVCIACNVLLCRGLRAEYHARGGANVAQIVHRVRLNGYGAADNAYYELCRAKQHVARYAWITALPC